MAASGTKIFGCPACGYRVGHDDKSCPRCSNKFTASTRFECPFCAELIDTSGGSCPSCHVVFDDLRERTKDKASDDSIDSLLTEIIRLEALEVKQEDKKLSCPTCSWLLSGTEEACPKCGKSLVEDFNFQCPVCGEMVDKNAAKCQECGAAFAEDLPPPKPPEPQRTEPVEATPKAEEEVAGPVAPAPESKKIQKRRKIRALVKQPPAKQA